MEDAYVIGIRLALDNGVSAGIAAIAHDLEGLDGAISATTAHLGQLRTAAGATGEAIAADFQRLARQGERLARDLAAPPAQLPPSSSQSVSLSVPPTPSTPATQPPLPKGATAPPNTTTPLPGEHSNGPIIRIAPIVTQPQSSAPSSSAGEAVPPSASHVRASPTNSLPLRPAQMPPPSVRLAPAARPSVAGKSPGRAQDPPSIVPAAPWLPTTSGADPIAPLARGQSPSAAAASAPVAFAPAAYAPARPASAAPAAAEHSSGATQGDVFLDGMRLGRWMTSHLAREATQPPAGATAFDPRMGLSWPGSQQGY